MRQRAYLSTKRALLLWTLLILGVMPLGFGLYLKLVMGSDFQAIIEFVTSKLILVSYFVTLSLGYLGIFFFNLLNASSAAKGAGTHAGPGRHEH